MKRSKAARKRWLLLSEEERRELEKKIAEGMRSYWSKLTLEERSAIGKKAAESRRRNREMKNVTD